LFGIKHFRCLDCNVRWAKFAFDIDEDKPTLFIWAGIIGVAVLFLML
jgi:hypothetical protein